MAESLESPRTAVRRAPTIKKPVGSGWILFGFAIVAALAYVVGALYGQPVRSAIGSQFNAQQELDLSSLQATYSALKNNYDGTLSDADLIEGANKGLVAAAGDDYTVFMSATESDEFNNELSGNIGGGIGVEMSIRNEVPTVVRLLENNPAQKAGVMVGDIVAKVNDESTEGWSLEKTVGKIKGEEGTSVKLTIVRAGAVQELSVTRAVVNNPSAYGSVKDGVGVLTISRFDENTGVLARRIAQDFKGQNVKGVVLDLRGNGGGYVTAAQAVAGIWLDGKTVVTEKANGKVVDELTSGSSPILNGVPTAVLINKSSASASEIVAGALHDYKAATLIGTDSFGKGSVQKIMSLSDGAMLKVTVARWFTPKGVNISEKGIKPDMTVERTVEDLNANKDPQLDAALTKLRS